MRYPLLGTELVDFMGEVPSRWKVQRLEKRVLFKRAMRGFLPDTILEKKKHGMGIPMAHWINNVAWFRRHVLDVVYQGRFTTGGWIERKFLEQIVEETRAGIWDYSNEIWRVYSLNRWIDHRIVS
jgi:asparagine synthase (glutamine-hydrolysing)